MKRLITVILAAAMVLALAGCAAETNNDSVTDPAVTEQNKTPERSWELVMRDESDALDIDFSVMPDTVTPSGATFRFTNTLEKTVWFGYNYDITVVIDGYEYDIVVPEADIPDGEWTIASGESADVAIDWIRKYGELPDGTYTLYMYPNYTDSQIENPMCAKFVIGSGKFDADDVKMHVTDDVMTDEELAPEFTLTGINQVEEIMLEVLFYKVDGSITPTGGSFVVENTTGYDVIFDQHFILTAYINGRYFDIAEITAGTPWEMPRVDTTVPTGESCTVEIDWEWLYGWLPDGQYSVFKLMQAYDMKDRAWTEARFNVGSGVFPDDVLTQAESIVSELPINTPEPTQVHPIGSLGDALEKISKRDDLFITVNEDSVSPTGAFFTFTNKRDENVLYGVDFKLAKKVDGEWRWLYPKEGDYWIGVAMYLEPDEEHTEHIYWEDIYGELENGEYMLIKDFRIHHEQVPHDIICEFTVTNYGEPVKPGDILRQAGWVNETDYVYVENLDMEIVPGSVSAAGAKVTVTNNRETEVEYGHDFAIYKKIGNMWFYLKCVDEYAAFTAEACILPSGESVTLDINWDWIYGELPDGDYAIAKTFSSLDKPFARNAGITDTPYQFARVITEFSLPSAEDTVTTSIS